MNTKQSKKKAPAIMEIKGFFSMVISQWFTLQTQISCQFRHYTTAPSSIIAVVGDGIIKLSADIHYNFVNIHPFGDGNGRTTRLLMNYIQLYHKEPLIKIFTEDRAEYIDSLNETEEKGDLTIFRDFICRQQIKFYEAELNKYKNSQSGFTLLFQEQFKYWLSISQID